MLEYMRISLSITMNSDGGTSDRSGIMLICTTIEAIGTTSDAEIFTALIPFGDNTDEDDDDEEEDDDDDDDEEKAATDLANIPMKRPPLDAPSRYRGSDSVLIVPYIVDGIIVLYMWLITIATLFTSE